MDVTSDADVRDGVARADRAQGVAGSRPHTIPRPALAGNPVEYDAPSPEEPA